MDKNKLISYLNICKASLEISGNFQQAPIFFLDVNQQIALFTENQRNAMLISSLRENIELQEAKSRYHNNTESISHKNMQPKRSLKLKRRNAIRRKKNKRFKYLSRKTYHANDTNTNNNADSDVD